MKTIRKSGKIALNFCSHMAVLTILHVDYSQQKAMERHKISLEEKFEEYFKNLIIIFCSKQLNFWKIGIFFQNSLVLMTVFRVALNCVKFS